MTDRGRRLVRNRTGFVRKFFLEFAHELFVHRQITRDRYDELVDQFKLLAREIAQQLFSSGSRGVDVPGFGQLKLRWLREPRRSDFPFIQVIPERTGRRARRPITCFVGHRFESDIAESLRSNLATIFEPHRIDPRWSGYEMSAVDLFNDIVKQIDRCDMCIFDNRGTVNRPNVYVEAGIAYTKKRPFLFCEHTPRSSAPQSGFPSNLTGLLRLQYRNYEHLCRQLYIQLPLFLKKNRLT